MDNMDNQTPLQKLTDIVKLDKDAYASWTRAAELKRSLLADLYDSAVDTSEVASLVSVQHRRAKLEVPRIAELRNKISELQDELAVANAEQVYQAQLQLQSAEEHLAALLTSDEILALRNELALLEHELRDSQPELTKSLVIRQRTKALLAAQSAL